MTTSPSVARALEGQDSSPRPRVPCAERVDDVASFAVARALARVSSLELASSASLAQSNPRARTTTHASSARARRSRRGAGRLKNRHGERIHGHLPVGGAAVSLCVRTRSNARRGLMRRARRVEIVRSGGIRRASDEGISRAEARAGARSRANGTRACPRCGRGREDSRTKTDESMRFMRSREQSSLRSSARRRCR